MTSKHADTVPEKMEAGDSGAVRAVVAGHGTFAAGVISAVHQITGRGNQFVPITNTGLCLGRHPDFDRGRT